jgi:ketosteroid isomerase-like protein
MSEENVEIVKGIFAAWNSGDMGALRDLYDRDVIVRAPKGWPEPGPFVGREAVMRQWAQQREVWHADDLEAISGFIEAGDRVVVRFIWHAAGEGPEAGFEMTGINSVRKGKVILQEFFWDHAEALEAAGLRGEDFPL